MVRKQPNVLVLILSKIWGKLNKKMLKGPSKIPTSKELTGQPQTGSSQNSVHSDFLKKKIIIIMNTMTSFVQTFNVQRSKTTTYEVLLPFHSTHYYFHLKILKLFSSITLFFPLFYPLNLIFDLFQSSPQPTR